MRGLAPAVLAMALATSGCSLALGSAAEIPEAPAGVVRGGTLRVGIATPASIDPAQAYDRAGQLVVSAMCNPLFEVDERNGEPHAGVTKNIVQEKSGNGVTVTLKDGLRFSDGTKASVKDVRASLSRVASDTQASPLAEEAKVILGFSLVHGDVPTENEDDPNRTILAGTQQVTGNVVSLLAAAPDAELPMHLARPWTAIVPAGRSDAADFPQRPVCVGPYRVEGKWDGAADTITLVRARAKVAANEAFTDGGRGYPDRIVFRLYDNDAAAFDGWLRGEVDVAPVSRDHLGVATPGGRVATAATPAMEYVGLPSNVAPFDDVAVRQALISSLDREALVAALRPVDRRAATSWVPSTLPGGVANPRICRVAAPKAGNVEAARSILQKKDISLAGREMKLYFNDEAGSGNRELMQAVADQWRAAFGIVPTLVPLPWNDYMTQGRSQAGFDGPFRTSWSSPVAAPGAWMTPLALSSSIPATNLTRFSAPGLDFTYPRLFLEQNDHAARRAFARNTVGSLCVTGALVPIWQGTQSFVVRDNVKSASGSLTRRTTGDLNIRELYVTRD